MFCTKCGTQMEDDALFCPECGNRVNPASAETENNMYYKAGTDNDVVLVKKKKSKVSFAIVFVILIVAFAGLGTVIFVRSNSPERRLQAQLDLGYKYLEELNYEQAIACFEATIEIDPKNIDAYHGLIYAYVGIDDPEGIMLVCDMASESLSGKDRKDIEKTAISELSRMIETEINNGDYDRAREIADSLSEVDNDAASKYVDQIASLGDASDDPVNVQTSSDHSSLPDPEISSSEEEVSLNAIAQSNNIHIMTDSFISAYLGNSVYFYTDDFTYSSNKLVSDDWLLRNMVSFYSMSSLKDSYHTELIDQEKWAENQNFGIGAVMSVFTQEQLDRITNSFTGSYKTVLFDDNSYIPGGVVKYSDGYYIFADGADSYVYNNGKVYADNYYTEKSGDDVILHVDVIVEDWNQVTYKAGELKIELSKNPDSIFDGYSFSDVSFYRTDLGWKTSLNAAIEETFTAIYDCWRLDPALKNENMWDYLKYYFVQADGDGIPDVVIDVDGPAAYVNTYNEFAVLHFNGNSVDISLCNNYDISFSGWTKYCYEDMLVILSDGAYGWGMEKPNIYIYPDLAEQETQVVDGHEVVEANVNLIINGGVLTSSWPNPVSNNNSYNWHVYASEDGTLYDDEGNEYSYLFWEGNSTWNPDFSEGFCVKGEDTAEFLRSVLSEIGLAPREYNEFIVYWAPRMENNEYNLISFQGDEYTSACYLNITDSEGKSPSNMLRVMMAWTALDEEVSIKPQTFEPFSRDGFTVVEWGGRECTR